MKKVLLVAVSVLLVCTSCVTKKKYLLAENGRLEAIARGDDLQNQLVNCRDNNDGLTSRLASLERDTTRMGKNIRNYQSMLNTNMTEQEKLNSLLSQKMNELDERERTINELQDMINAQTERVQNLLNSVKDALLGFSSDELTVREKDGKVYVAMSDKLLFESGSARVDKRGKEALAKLAEVLNKQSDIDVYIEGHTDSKPINTAQFKDNWDLSVIRATSVVRILTKDYGVKPLQIQPCGRGEFMPVADNETADGRAKNRRTEIIMAPKLENAVLFAAGSCWEGVDFPGDMVSSLIIVKLPFSVPDPIHEAQKEQYRSLESYIQTIVVPDMQKKLRQGFGRAIRTEQDTCVVSILDHRTAKKGRYRSDVLEALPKCQMAERIEEVENFIRSRKVERYYS